MVRSWSPLFLLSHSMADEFDRFRFFLSTLEGFHGDRFALWTMAQVSVW